MKVERGLNPEEQKSLDHWLEQDPRHLGAFVRAQAAWIHAERATALGTMPTGEPEQVAPPPPDDQSDNGLGLDRRLGRRRLLAGGGALAASIAAGFFVFDRPRVIESGVGEVRRLTLAGGTTLTLDTDTRVDVANDSGDRKLKLARGKLFLDVSDDASALAVEAGGLVLEMVEGAFALQALNNMPLVALVTKGSLAVSQGGLFAERRDLTIDAGQMFTLPLGANLASARIGAVDLERSAQWLAWRDGMLAFSGESLAQAVRAFDRYSPTRIVVADPELAEQKITGLFKADDPKGFARAVGASFGATAVQRGDVIRLSRRNAPEA
ncbi:MAG: FecR domain-containing protein [Sphingopyxis sp.]|nr:FecR domain-containing protein [Sphingopyxis sp.]